MAPGMRKLRKAPPHLQTEPRVTRSQCKVNPHLAPKTEAPPRQLVPIRKKREYAQPWVNFVPKSGRTVVAARRNAGKEVRKASDEKRAEWKKKAKPPKEQRSISFASTVQTRFISPRKGRR